MFDTKPKLLILGYARHGKDTVAELLRDDYGFSFTSSSMFVAEECLWDHWGCAVYPDFEAMYADRVNHRKLWMEMISAYNTPDKTKTASTMLSRGFDMYVGMRRHDELLACQEAGIFDFIIWVDASLRHPPETGSMDITEENSGADYTLFNNGKLEELPEKLAILMAQINREWNDRNGIPEHPWDSMSPVEQTADWLGVHPHTLFTLEDQITVDIPVRAAPALEVIQQAMIELGTVMWHDPIDNKMCLKPINIFADVLDDYDVSDSVEDDESDPWADFMEHVALVLEFEDGGEVDPDPVGINGPEFISRRSKVGAVEEALTTTKGATTIINIENVYIVGDTEE